MALSGTVDSTLQVMCQKTLEHGQARRPGPAALPPPPGPAQRQAPVGVGGPPSSGRERERESALRAPRSSPAAPQVCMAADNLYHQCSKRSHISRPTYSHPLEQLGVIQDYVNDLTFIAQARSLGSAWLRPERPAACALCVGFLGSGAGGAAGGEGGGVTAQPRAARCRRRSRRTRRSRRPRRPPRRRRRRSRPRRRWREQAEATPLLLADSHVRPRTRRASSVCVCASAAMAGAWRSGQRSVHGELFALQSARRAAEGGLTVACGCGCISATTASECRTAGALGGCER